MAKIYSAPGVSSRRLTVAERLAEFQLDLRLGRRSSDLERLRRALWTLRHPLRALARAGEYRRLLRALSIGRRGDLGGALRVESLGPTMRCVTFRVGDLTLASRPR